MIKWIIGLVIIFSLFLRGEYSLPEKDIITQPNAKIIHDFRDKDGNISFRIVTLD